MNFNQLPQTQKGYIGEAIVRGILQRQGWYVYSLQDEPDRSHHIDTIALKIPDMLLMDTKTKPRRQNYSDTGIDLRHRNTYLELSAKYNLPVFIAFCDEVEQSVYGNYLSELEVHRPAGTVHGFWYKGTRRETTLSPWDYPQFYQKIVYYPLSVMYSLAQLTDEQIVKIKKYTTRSGAYRYAPELRSMVGTTTMIELSEGLPCP